MSDIPANPFGGPEMQAPQVADPHPDAPLSPPSWLERLPGDDNPFAKMLRSAPATGSVSIAERARLNSHEAYYRGSPEGLSRLIELDQQAENPIPAYAATGGATGVSQVEAMSPAAAAEEAGRIRLNLARYEAMPGFDGPLEGTVAFSSQLGTGLLSPTSWITRYPGVTKFIGKVAGEAADTVAARIFNATVSQGLIQGTIIDPITQVGSISANLQEGWDGARTALMFGLGAATGGVLHGAGEAVGAAAAPLLERRAAARESATFTPYAERLARERLYPPQPAEAGAAPPPDELTWLRVEDPSFQSFPTGGRPTEVTPSPAEAGRYVHTIDGETYVTNSPTPPTPEQIAQLDQQQAALTQSLEVLRQGAPQLPEQRETPPAAAAPAAPARQFPAVEDPLVLAQRGELTAARAGEIRDTIEQHFETVENEVFGPEDAAKLRRLHRQSNAAWDRADDARAKELDAQIDEIEKRAAPEDLAHIEGRGGPDHLDPEMWRVITANLERAEGSREGGIAVIADQLRYLPTSGAPTTMSEREAIAVIGRAMQAEADRGGAIPQFLDDAFKERMERYGGARSADAQELVQDQAQRLQDLMRNQPAALPAPAAAGAGAAPEGISGRVRGSPTGAAAAPPEGVIAGAEYQKLIAQGVPEAEARDIALFTQLRYQGRAAQNLGRRGTAEELYREAPDVVTGEPGALQPGELEQRGQRTVEVGGHQLLLNPDGTVTLFHATKTPEAADRVVSQRTLRSGGEPAVYLSTAARDTGYGDHVIAVNVDPKLLRIDDEFPGGRADFAIDRRNVKVANAERMPSGPLGADPAEHALTALDILSPDTPARKANSRTVGAVAAELQARGQAALRNLGVRLGVIDGPSPRTDEILSRAIATEVRAAAQRTGHALDWYTKKVREAMRIASAIHPELATDINARMAFRSAMAITSQGETVTSNIRLTNIAYEYFKTHGRFPTNLDVADPAINANLAKFNRLYEDHGPDGLREFLQTEFTVRELEAETGLKIGGELKDTRVYGSAVFGPKIGQGFYQNLNGNFVPVTMDLWFMRAWGRLTGKLVGGTPEARVAQRARLEAALEAEGRPVPQTRPALERRAEAITAEHERNYKKYRAEYEAKTRTKSELVLAAERFIHGLHGINETPTSGAMRNWMRARVERARELLAAEGMPITNADLQALWWYPEKDLYGKMGGKDPEALNTDYASAMRELATQKGISDADIASAVGPVEHGPRPADAGDVGGTAESVQPGRGPAAGEQAAGAAGEPREPGATEGAAPGELEQAGRAKIRRTTEDARALITLYRDAADASSLIHENFHAWTDELFRDALHPDAPPELVADAATLRRAVGAKEGEALTTEQLEQLAQWGEQYAREGLAPTPELTSAFARFREWLLNIYQTITELGVPINDEVRAVFDHMFTPAERARVAAEAATGARGGVVYTGREPVAGISGRVPVRGTPSPAGGAASVSGEALRTLHQQAFDLADAINFPLRQGRMAHRDFAGQYDNLQDVVRQRAVADFEVVSHEAGHAIERHVGDELTQLTNRFASELAPLDYDPVLRRVNEGFAEFMRNYLTGAPGYAERLAPDFAEAFRGFMADKQPAILAELERARAAYQAYVQAPTEKKLDAIVQRAEPTGVLNTIRTEGLPGTISLGLAHGYQAVFDDRAPVARAVRDLARLYRDASGNRLNLQGSTNPELLVRMAARSHQAAVRDMLDGVRPYHGVEPEGPSLRDALIKATGEPGIFGRWDDAKVKEFSNYLVARRSEVLWAKYKAGELQRRPLAMSESEIAEAVAQAEAANPGFAAAGDMVHQYTRQLLRKQFEGGLIDRELFDKLSKEPFYVPLYRRMDDKPLLAPDRPTAGGTTEGPGTIDLIRRQTGSDRDIIDPIQGLMTQTFLLERTLAHNDIIKSFDALAEQARKAGATGVGRIVERLSASEIKAQKFDLREGIENAARQAGIDPDDTKLLLGAVADTFGDDPIMAQVFRRQQTSPRGEPIVFYKDGGELKALRFMSKGEGMALYETLTSLPPVMRDWAISIGAASATALRAGIVANPVFALTNFVRDQLAAAILRPGYLPFNPRGIFRELGQDKYAQMYAAGGGVAPGAAATGVHEMIVDRSIEELARKGWAVQKIGAIGDLVTQGKVLGAMKAFGEAVGFTETGTRLNVMKSVFEQKKREGLSDYDAMMEAAYQATDLLDFGRHGSKTATIRSLIPFLNVHMQSLDKARRTLFEPLWRAARGDLVTEGDVAAVKNAGAALGLLGVSAALGTAYAVWGAQHEAYQDANEELRATHLIIPGGAFGLPGKILLVPKPFELAIGFNLGEMLGLGLATGDPRVYGFAVGGVQEVLLPPNLLNSIPIIKSYAELALNKSFFTKREIVPQHLQALTPAEQFIPGQTSILARQIGGALGVSPIKVEYAIGSGFGLWGKDLLAGSSAADPDAPAAALENTMFLRRFIKGADVASETTKRFWNLAGQQTGEYAQAKNTYDAMIGTFREKDAAAFLGAIPTPERAYVTLQSSADEDGKAVFNADDKRLHPLTRAAQAVLSNTGYIRELQGNTQQSIESRERLALDPEHRRDVIAAVRQLSAIEQRNALRIVGEPAYAGRKLLSAEDQLGVIRAISPEAADEVAARYAAAKIVPTETTARLWPEAQQRLLAEGSEAELRDLAFDAKADGFAFEADRVKRAPPRRLPIAPAPTPSPIALPAMSPPPSPGAVPASP